MPGNMLRVIRPVTGPFRVPLASSFRTCTQVRTRNIHATSFLNNEKKLACEEIPAKLYDYNKVKQLVDHPIESTILIDVREPQELADQGYIPSAFNIPFKSTPGALNLPADEFEDAFKFPKPSTDKELVFYCQAGVRSTAAEELASTFGYVKRGNYPGSFNDWVAHGGKVAKK